jgi:hypothetical protein
MIPWDEQSQFHFRGQAMSRFRSMPFARRTSILGVAAVLAITSASAQSSLSSNMSSPSLFAANESSSIVFQPAAADGLGGASALPSAAKAGGSGGGAGQGGHGWKYKASHNFALEFGGGFSAPIGNDSSANNGGPFITWGGNFTAGGGLHFNKYLSLLAEYQFIGNKLPGSMIADVGTQGGNAHIWSFTLDPVIDLFPKRTNSVYVTGGGGFYRKLTNFTIPENVEYCDYWCEIDEVNETVYHFSSNQGGLNLGFGITHRLGGINGDGKMKLYAEARYLFLNTPRLSANTFPYAVGTTELIPVTFGVRW